MNYCFPTVKTGGLDHQTSALLELGCIVTDQQFQELDTFCTYIDGPESLIIEDEALKYNKIKLEDLKDAVPEKTALINFNSLLKQYDYPTFIGYQILFELSFLNSATFRQKLVLACDGNIVDLMLASRHSESILYYSLKGIAGYYGIVMNSDDRLNKARVAIKIAKNLFGGD